MVDLAGAADIHSAIPGVDLGTFGRRHAAHAPGVPGNADLVGGRAVEGRARREGGFG
jgi:hypothetical protein